MAEQDRRIRKTKKALHSALLSLMKDKTLPEISVRELTQAADVNRKTFYNHYNGIYAVLDEVEDECVEHLIELLDMENYAAYIENPELFFRKLITELRDNEEFYTLLNQSRTHSHISQKLIRRMRELMRGLIDANHLNEVWVDYFLNFMSAGTTSVINSWFQSEKKIPIEALASFFGMLFTSGDVRRFIQAAQAPVPGAAAPAAGAPASRG